MGVVVYLGAMSGKRRLNGKLKILLTLTFNLNVRIKFVSHFFPPSFLDYFCFFLMTLQWVLNKPVNEQIRD